MPFPVRLFFVCCGLLLCVSSQGGIGSGDLSPSPSPSFGTAYVNSSASLSVTLTNVSFPSKIISNVTLSSPALAEPFAYLGGSFPGTGGTCSGAVLDSNQSCTVVLRFLPTSVGSFSSTLNISYKLQNTTKTISFPVTGTGALSPPTLALSRSTYDFQSRPVGSTSQVTLTLSNLGQQTAMGLNIPTAPSGAFSFLGGTYPGTGGTCGTSLSPGAQCDIKIAFSPSAAQSYSSNLTITGSGGTNTASVNFLGTGQTRLSAGTADPGFGSGTGVASLNAGSSNETLTSISYDGDGNQPIGAGFAYSMAAETNEFVISKFNPDGSPDTGFNSGGFKTIGFPGSNAFATSSQLLSSGGILATGSAGNKFALALLNSSGTLDTTLAGTGQVQLNLNGGSDDFSYASLVQPDGKVVLVGTSSTNGLYRVALTRVTLSGAFDPTFNGTGVNILQIGQANSMAYAAALQSDGKIIVVGTAYSSATANYDFMIARFTSSGALDTTFNGTGYAFKDFNRTGDLANSVTILSNGKYAVGGRIMNNSTGALAAGVTVYNTDGTLFGSYQTAFESGRDAFVNIKEGPSPNYDLFMAWYVSTNSSPTIRMTNLTSSLSPRITFGTNGTLTTNIKSSRGQMPAFYIDANGRLVVGGQSLGDLALSRYY